MRKFTSTLPKNLLLLSLGVLLGAAGVYTWLQPHASQANRNNEFRSQTSRGHEFTNPLLRCAELPESITIGTRKNIEADLQSLIAEKQSDGTILEASVYYRDLNNGPWFGIREETTFDPASLFKVPLAMTYFWLANEGSPVLEDQIKFTGPPGVSIEFFPPQNRLEVGTTYTVRDMIKYMLKESDNDAAHILSEYAGLEERNQLYQDLGLRPLESGKEYQVDVHTYASFFRILYNATYLGILNSEEILKILSESSFTQGLVAGLPSSIRVSHKFGEHVRDVSGNKVYQLHDCGIVYVPNKPYVLCVMTRGNDMQKLPGFIASISKLVYEEVK